MDDLGYPHFWKLYGPQHAVHAIMLNLCKCSSNNHPNLVGKPTSPGPTPASGIGSMPQLTWKALAQPALAL